MAEITPRRGTSAAYRVENKPFESSADPLAPWSTRGITNLNTILTGDQSDQESF